MTAKERFRSVEKRRRSLQKNQNIKAEHKTERKKERDREREKKMPGKKVHYNNFCFGCELAVAAAGQPPEWKPRRLSRAQCIFNTFWFQHRNTKNQPFRVNKILSDMHELEIHTHMAITHTHTHT